MPRIAILVHEKDTFLSTHYFLRAIAASWHQQGIQPVLQQGIGPVLPVDLAVMHVDLTVTPDSYIEMAAQYPRVLNGRVTDISKHTISRYRVAPGDGYQGPVMVKTNCNFGGLQELRATQGNIPPKTARSRLNYRVLASPADVPEELWQDPDWIVERFMSEKEGDLFCLRTWMFLGDKETNSICYSAQPIVKSRNIVRRERVDEIPGELRTVRQQMGFDFGKFDYAIVDGEVVLYDTNRTPALGNFQPEVMAPTVELLAQGIHAYL